MSESLRDQSPYGLMRFTRRMFAWLAVAIAGNVGMLIAHFIECEIAWFVSLGVWAVCITVSIINLIKLQGSYKMSEQKTHAEIIARMRSDAEEDEYTPDEILWQTLRSLADSLEEAQRREIDVLKRRINELDAEIAAKDEVIKRLNDAIAEDQRRKMAAAENSSAVGDTAKLREALKATLDLFFDIHNANRSPQSNQAYAVIHKIKAALAAPPRNCDKYPTFNDAIRALADKRGWHDAKWDSERYCILASWLLAPATEKEGGNDGRK